MEYPIRRELDGVFFRIERDGRWTNVCFTDLTEDEQRTVIKKYDDEKTLRLLELLLGTYGETARVCLEGEEIKTAVIILASVIRKTADIFDIDCIEPEIEEIP